MFLNLLQYIQGFTDPNYNHYEQEETDMMKLNKQVDSLQAVIDKIQEKIDTLQEKMDALEEKAGDEDRDLTKAEQNRFDKWEEEISELEDEMDSVQNAIDYLMDYCE